MGDRQGSWSLGVDAGATRCRARLRASDGTVVAEAEGPAANAYVNFERAVEVARGGRRRGSGARRPAASDTSDVQTGPRRRRRRRRGGGGAVRRALRGLRRRARRQRRGRRLHRRAWRRRRRPDRSSAPARRASRASAGAKTIVGGRGFHLGDDGSAARLGLEAARAAMRAARRPRPAKRSHPTNSARASPIRWRWCIGRPRRRRATTAISRRW